MFSWPLQPWLPEGMQSSFSQCFVRVSVASRGGGRMGGETLEVVINTWFEHH